MTENKQTSGAVESLRHAQETVQKFSLGLKEPLHFSHFLPIPGPKSVEEFFGGKKILADLIKPTSIEMSKEPNEEYEKQIRELREILGKNAKFLDMTISEIGKELEFSEWDKNVFVNSPDQIVRLRLSTEAEGVFYHLFASVHNCSDGVNKYASIHHRVINSSN